MKYIKKLFAMLLFVVLSFATSVSAATTAPSSFTIKASDTSMLYGSNILGHGSTLNFTYKVNTSGLVVYCTEMHDTMTTTSETYTYAKEADAGIASILANGYPNKSLTGDNKTDYYITGLAIWYYINPSDSSFTYFDLSKGTYKGYSSTVVQWISKLVNDAKNASYSTPSLKLNSSSSSMSLSDDGKYYYSQAMSISGSSIGNVSVSLSGAPSGSYTVDSNWSSKSTFAAGDTFYVIVPVSSISSASTSFSVKVSASGTNYKAYVYNPTYASHQSLAALYADTVDLSDSTTLEISAKTKVTISKLDIANDEELEGATLVIKDADGKVVDTWVSGKEAHVIENLPFGTYTLTETIAPDGYVRSEETISFTLSADKLEASAVMYNSKKAPTKVVISKQDITTGEELPGAHLVLKDKDGNIIDEWVSGDKPHEITSLKPGETYILTETLQPDGYVLNTESIEFTVNEDGTVTTVVMYNAPTEVIKEVPKTGTFKTITYSLIGILVIAIGSLMIFRNIKNNEN